MRAWAAVAIAATLAAVVCARDCVEANRRATFTACNDATNTMYAVQFFNETCRATEAVQLAPPAPARCDMPCDSGQFFDPLTVRCTDCNPGSSSNSGGRIIRDFTTGIPDGFVTYCDPAPCRAWSPGPLGGILTSGNQSGLRTSDRPGWPADETVKSELVTIVDVINPRGGKFFFSYRVESEHYYDGLRVLINGTQYYDPSEPNTHDYRSRFLLSGIHLNWRRIAIPLPALGTTEVRLVFSKDRDQASLRDAAEAGLDRAFVRDIVIEGVQMFAPTCTPCAPGTAALLPRTIECHVCPANTFSKAGSAECFPCPDTAWSAPGSSECIPRPPCTQDDYVAVYGNCLPNRTRSRRWQVAGGSKCMPNAPGAATPRASEMVPCAACMRGFTLAANGECTRCELGQKREATGECVTCPAGLASVPSITFDDGFDQFGSTIDPRFFAMQCVGECAGCTGSSANCTADNSGFTLVSLPSLVADDDSTTVAIRSLPGNGGTFLSTLRYTFDSVASGFFSFKYFFHHTAQGRTATNEALTAAVRFDNQSSVMLNTRATINSRDSYFQSYLQSGRHTIDIIVSQSLEHAPADDVQFTITAFTVSGDVRGAATQCEVCQPGTYCPAGAAGMIPCPAGTSNPSYQQSACARCEDGFFAPSVGMRACQRCPLGTASTDARDRCTSTCHVHVDNLNYDLSALADVYYGPIEAATFNPSSYYMNLCNYVNRNGTSSVCEARNGVELERSYACQHYTASRSYSLGTDPAFARDAEGALTFGVTGGDYCSHGGMARSTNITLVCDPSVTNAGRIEFVREEPHCHYQFSLRTAVACPLCEQGSFRRIEGQCDRNGQVQISWAKRPEAMSCSRGYAPPAAVNVSCDRCLPSYLEPQWAACEAGVQNVVFAVKGEHIGCTDDGSAEAELRARYREQKIPLNRTCHQVNVEVGANAFTAATAIILVILLVLVALLCICNQRLRAVQTEYQTLQAANAEMNTNGEMTTIPREVQSNVERANAARRANGPGVRIPAAVAMPTPQRDVDSSDIGEDGGEPVPAAAPKLEDA